VYGEGGRSEEYLGAALKGRRDGAIIATKFGYDRPGAKEQAPRQYLRQAVEASLRRLDTDRIDLYQMHWPDPATSIEETLSALDELVGAGKVRYVGHSNFAGWQVADAAWIARTRGLAPFVSAQNHYGHGPPQPCSFGVCRGGIEMPPRHTHFSRYCFRTVALPG
jgi:aryl-alcohol dehydrogenase-like predicted oxidoreductase